MFGSTFCPINEVGYAFLVSLVYAFFGSVFFGSAFVAFSAVFALAGAFGAALAVVFFAFLAGAASFTATVTVTCAFLFTRGFARPRDPGIHRLKLVPFDTTTSLM